MNFTPMTLGTLGVTALREALPTAVISGMNVLNPPPAGSLESSREVFRNLTASSHSEPSAARLFGFGLPALAHLTAEEFAFMVAGAGIVTLLIRGVQKFWELKVAPFGELKELNRLVHSWAVMDAGDARAQAKRIGEAFLVEVKKLRSEYDNKHLQVSWNVEPKKWAQRDDIRQRMTTRYAKRMGETFQQFAQGLGMLVRGDYGHVYKDAFEGFLKNVATAIQPIAQWQPPLTEEDEINFRTFQKVLRHEILALEMKLEELSEPHIA